MNSLEKVMRIMMANKGVMWKAVAEKFNESTGDSLTRQTLKTRISKGTITIYDFIIICEILGCSMYITRKNMNPLKLTIADCHEYFIDDIPVMGAKRLLEYLGFSMEVKENNSGRPILDTLPNGITLND